MFENNKVINMTNNVKNEIKQSQNKIDLLTNQLDQNRTKQSMMSKEEFKLKQLIMDKKEVLYNLVSVTIVQKVIFKNTNLNKYINLEL